MKIYTLSKKKILSQILFRNKFIKNKKTQRLFSINRKQPLHFLFLCFNFLFLCFVGLFLCFIFLKSRMDFPNQRNDFAK